MMRKVLRGERRRNRREGGTEGGREIELDVTKKIKEENILSGEEREGEQREEVEKLKWKAGVTKGNRDEKKLRLKMKKIRRGRREGIMMNRKEEVGIGLRKINRMMV